VPPVYRSAVASDGPRPGPTCESCGHAGRPRRAVRRVYLAADEGGALRVAVTEPDAEWWCPSCVAQYPNEPVAGD